MPEELKIIWLLAIGFGVACFFGYVAERLKLSPILGYLIGGYLIGPNFPGFVADPYMSEQLASIGVTLLMFAVGLSFNWKDLIAVRKLALPGALLLSAISIGAGIFYSVYLGESVPAGIVIGLAICVSSTVVIIRVLTDQNLLRTQQGHIVVGWTIVEDLISVLGLVLLPVLIQSSKSNFFLNLSSSIGIALFKMALLAIFVYFIGKKLLEKILTCIARTRSHELFTLAVLASVFLIAVGSSYMFGVSLALGAFIAGTTVGKTEVNHQAAANALPMRDAFAVIFFLSIGMLFNPIVVMHHLPLFFGILVILLFIRPLLAFLIVKIAKYPTPIAFTVAIAIAQIGEYSFILAEEGSHLKVLPDSAFDILVACAFISVALNPLLFQLFKPFIFMRRKNKILENPDPTFPSLDTPDTDWVKRSAQKVIVVGFGPVGQSIAHHLIEKQYRVTLIDQNIDTISFLKGWPIEALFGDATQLQILETADLENSALLVITTPDFQITQAIIQSAQQIHPYIKVLARAHFKADLNHTGFGDISIICDEEASSEKMITAIDIMLPAFNRS
jgi:CPA2 family monovalent cation:H+ antiporter-2